MIADRTCVGIDSLGRVNGRMEYKNATRWVCNNPDCHAMAFVRDDAITDLLDHADDVEVGDE